jgi:FAD:protein FMN transferase
MNRITNPKRKGGLAREVILPRLRFGLSSNLPRLRFGLVLLLIAPLLLATFAAAAEPMLARFEYREPHMGTTVRIVLYAKDRTAANTAARAGFDRIRQLDERLSDYKPDSELSRLSAGSPHAQPVAVSDDLWTVLVRSQQIARDSEGAFDITVGPYTKLWRRTMRQKELPSDERLAEARDAVGFKHLALDEKAKTARLARPKMRLDLGGIAKGFAADEALAAIRAGRVRQALVAVSGDIALGEAPPRERGWRVAIEPLEREKSPPRSLELSRCGISTSGGSRQFVEIEGRRYTHILDPRTGMGIQRDVSVTVIALDAITADGLATAITIVGNDKGVELIKKYEGAATRIAEVADGRATVVASPNWDATVAAKAAGRQ